MFFTLISMIFILGYVLIILEHNIGVDKAASAILTAVAIWVCLMFGADELLPNMPENVTQGVANLTASQIEVKNQLSHLLSEVGEILFFIMGAMTIVELIDAHDGFKTITDNITTKSKVKLLWTVCILTFILSAIIDNLATTIVMISLLRKIIGKKELRWTFVGMVVISANAGGAWSPIGDVTTTMLWIGHQITAKGIILNVFLPSLVCMLVPLTVLSFTLKGELVEKSGKKIKEKNHEVLPARERNTFLILGISLLLFVPIFKSVTHLPPYMGMMFGLGILWFLTEIRHGKKENEERHPLTVLSVMRKIDMTSILFFFGILISVGGLATAGHLGVVADFLKTNFDNTYLINMAIGLLSALVDNVPLVAGAMKMYPLVTPEMVANASNPEWLNEFITDGIFWQFLAYCAGTGGSCIIMGSAAGVVAMSMEKINFMWYMRKISLLALLGYLSGAGVYVLTAL
ncbi:MAG: sodium:proton antiporter NhaD [Moraxellaceae bacterium]|nr:sodium:proton antiporter NhaD [Moraxellaceae bacterium]